jgi:hypothetical protein
MNRLKKFSFWLAVVVTGIIWAVALDALLSIGPFGHKGYGRGDYDTGKFCGLVKPGMELGNVYSRMLSVGKPNAVEYDASRLYVGSKAGILCMVQMYDSAAPKVIKSTPIGGDSAGQATRVCALVKPDMELGELKSLMVSAERPGSVLHAASPMMVSGSERSKKCVVDIDPATQKVISAHQGW